MKRLSLQLRIFFLIIIIVSISVVVNTLLVNKYFKDFIVKSGAEKVLYAAQIAANDNRIVAAFDLDDPSEIIQPVAEKIREITKTSFVVIINMQSIRYSHPNIENLGRVFVGGDEGAAIHGETYVSEAKGTLGISLRAFTPIFNEQKQQIGVASVGLLLMELEEQNHLVRLILLITSLISISIGLGGAILLSGNIKKTIFGLEPYHIASLLEERDAIISSVKEGIIAVDRECRIILVNNNAKRLLDNDDIPLNTLISDLFPKSKLPEVIDSKKEILNQEQFLNGRQILVNNIPLIHKDTVIGAVASLVDISEILSLTAELKEIKSYSDALRSQHHEYLNRLNVMSGLMQLGKFNEATEFIVSTVSNQQNISDLLRKKVLTPSISGLLIAKINRANEQHIDLIINPESFLPKVDKKVAVSLVSIIGNILENSIESLNNSSQKNKEITIFFKNSENDITIRISDNGRGIPPELKDKIFEYGYSSKASSSSRGIGLFLVKEQVELLSGKIELILDKNGLVFEIVLLKKNIMQES